MTEEIRALAAQGLVQGLELKRPRRWWASADSRALRSLAEHMRELQAHLSAITCIDQGEVFELLYHFDLGGELLTVSVRVLRALPSLPSIADIYPAADFYEREIAEMFGVRFEGAPRTGHLLLPDDWPEHEYPLRRW